MLSFAHEPLGNARKKESTAPLATKKRRGYELIAADYETVGEVPYQAKPFWLKFSVGGLRGDSQAHGRGLASNSWIDWDVFPDDQIFQLFKDPLES